MKKILLVLLISCSFLFSATSSLEKAYAKGKKIALKIDKSVAGTVRVQKCKYFVLFDKTISAKMRNEAYRGCEDGVNK